MSPQAQTALRKKIAEQAGKKIRTIFTDLHTKILSRTAFNTGRTIGSWYGSADIKMSYDIGGAPYTPGGPHTNYMAVGSEPGREVFEQRSLSTTSKIDFEKNPYRIFFLTNGASLDSITDSGLNQGPGSRAAYQEFGIIAGYNLYTPGEGNDFLPRGTNAVELAVAEIRRIYGRL